MFHRRVFLPSLALEAFSALSRAAANAGLRWVLPLSSIWTILDRAEPLAVGLGDSVREVCEKAKYVHQSNAATVSEGCVAEAGECFVGTCALASP